MNFVADKYLDYLSNTRDYLHKYPELSGKEENTFNFIWNELLKLGLEPKRVGKYNIICEKGSNKGKTVLLRADIDGLPIKENKENKDIYSLNPGVSHACGHDCHTAILLTVAKIISEENLTHKSNLIYCFESGEERGIGVKEIIPAIKNKNIDAVFSLHITPMLKGGIIGVAEEECMTGSSKFKVTISGKGGHGSSPHLTNDPIMCLVDILSMLKNINFREISPQEVLSIGFGEISAGKALNIIPDESFFTGTMRFYNYEVEEEAKKQFYSTVNNICELYDCNYEIEYDGPKPPVINDRKLFNIVKKSVIENLGEEKFIVVPPVLPSETIGRYFKYFPGVYLFLGVGDEKNKDSQVHTPDLCIDNKYLENGVKATLSFLKKFEKEC